MKKTTLAALTLSVLVLPPLLIAAWALSERRPDMPAVSQAAHGVPDSDFDRFAGKRVFFGHQSVGANILDGLAAAYREHSTPAPAVIDVTGSSAGAAVPASGGVIAHAFIGSNGDPAGKMRDFDARLRAGLAGHVDVAVMKLCYVDVTRDTDAAALFGTYRKTLDALQRDYPNVVFLHATVPLTTEPRRTTMIKNVLKRDPGSSADNVVREAYNALIRTTYPGNRVLDIAALESTEPQGTRVGGSRDGSPYYALYPGYASDDGHLNTGGAAKVASELVRLVVHTGD